MKNMQTEKDIEILAKTIYGEARGEDIAGKKGIACVIMNRFKSKKWYAGKTIADTCLKKYQFSCWNDNDPNKKILDTISIERLGDCYDIAYNAVHGHQPDIVLNSTHYHTKDVKPKWAENKKPILQIGNHLFYNNID